MKANPPVQTYFCIYIGYCDGCLLWERAWRKFLNYMFLPSLLTNVRAGIKRPSSPWFKNRKIISLENSISPDSFSGHGDYFLPHTKFKLKVVCYKIVALQSDFPLIYKKKLPVLVLCHDSCAFAAKNSIGAHSWHIVLQASI